MLVYVLKSQFHRQNRMQRRQDNHAMHKSHDQGDTGCSLLDSEKVVLIASWCMSSDAPYHWVDLVSRWTVSWCWVHTLSSRPVDCSSIGSVDTSSECCLYKYSAFIRLEYLPWKSMIIRSELPAHAQWHFLATALTLGRDFTAIMILQSSCCTCGIVVDIHLSMFSMKTDQQYTSLCIVQPIRSIAGSKSFLSPKFRWTPVAIPQR